MIWYTKQETALFIKIKASTIFNLLYTETEKTPHFTLVVKKA
jgi:hypothetical protein